MEQYDMSNFPYLTTLELTELLPVSLPQLKRWAQAGLLISPTRHSLGRGGMKTHWAPDTDERAALIVQTMVEGALSLKQAAYILLGESYTIMPPMLHTLLTEEAARLERMQTAYGSYLRGLLTPTREQVERVRAERAKQGAGGRSRLEVLLEDAQSIGDLSIDRPDGNASYIPRGALRDSRLKDLLYSADFPALLSAAIAAERNAGEHGVLIASAVARAEPVTASWQGAPDFLLADTAWSPEELRPLLGKLRLHAVILGAATCYGTVAPSDKQRLQKAVGQEELAHIRRGIRYLMGDSKEDMLPVAPEKESPDRLSWDEAMAQARAAFAAVPDEQIKIDVAEVIADVRRERAAAREPESQQKTASA